MRKLSFLVGTVTHAVLFVLLASAASGKPNIVVIMTDDQDEASFAKMPLTQIMLAQKGVRFTKSVVNYSLCCPSRATFLTGQHSRNHGVQLNTPPQGGYKKLNHANTFPVWLTAAGYKTALIGKYLNGYGSEVPPTTIPPGWNEWQGLPDPTVFRYFNYKINVNGTLVTYGAAAADYKTDVLTQRAKAFIQAQTGSSQPFFLWITYTAPHGPADPAPRHAGIFASEPLPMPPNFNEPDVSDKPSLVQFPALTTTDINNIRKLYRKRLESLLAVDEGIRDIINKLAATGKLSNTYVIFTSDNGFFQGQHRIPNVKYFFYEESIRVPLIIRGPGVPANQTRAKLVSNVDLAPTIVDIADASPGLPMDGKSLLPLLTNASTPWRTAAFIDGRAQAAGNAWFDAVRTDRYLYGEFEIGARELYDLQTDPYQLTNRANDSAYASIRTNLQTKLNRLKTCTGASCWVTSP